jgi:hypothetical protein
LWPTHGDSPFASHGKVDGGVVKCAGVSRVGIVNCAAGVPRTTLYAAASPARALFSAHPHAWTLQQARPEPCSAHSGCLERAGGQFRPRPCCLQASLMPVFLVPKVLIKYNTVLVRLSKLSVASPRFGSSSIGRRRHGSSSLANLPCRGNTGLAQR